MENVYITTTYGHNAYVLIKIRVGNTPRRRGLSVVPNNNTYAYICLFAFGSDQKSVMMTDKPLLSSKGAHCIHL